MGAGSVPFDHGIGTEMDFVRVMRASRWAGLLCVRWGNYKGNRSLGMARYGYGCIYTHREDYI